MAAPTLHIATACAVAFCVLVGIVQLLDVNNRVSLQSTAQPRHRSATLQKLGQDKDWHVKEWSKDHLKAVSAGHIEPTTVQNIWHSKDQAWSGIDDILPTGGPFSYQTNHFLNANEARLLDYVAMVKKSLKEEEGKLPTGAPKNLKSESPAKFEQRLNEVDDVLRSEEHSFSEVAEQAKHEHTVHKAPTAILAETAPSASDSDSSAPAAAAAAAEPAPAAQPDAVAAAEASPAAAADGEAPAAAGGQDPTDQAVGLVKELGSNVAKDVTRDVTAGIAAADAIPARGMAAAGAIAAGAAQSIAAGSRSVTRFLTPSAGGGSGRGGAGQPTAAVPAAQESARPAKAAARRQPAEREYVDEAMYGEGIQGDIRPLGHHRRQWSGKAARRQIDQYVKSLPVATRKGAPWHGSKQNMDDYFDSLNRRDAAKEARHAQRLRRDGYWHQHPEERRFDH